MKVIVFLAAVILIAHSATLEEEWTNFKALHQKSYRSMVQERVRFNIFKTNLEKINEHNKKFDLGLTTYKMGVNQFTDLTSEEFVAMLKSSGPVPQIKASKVHMAPSNPSLLADDVDWRTKGAVTPVKNQGQCGSCWSFSTTGTLEAQYFFANGQLLSFSEQCLVDCSTSYGNQGCNGGWMGSALDYIKDHGIPTEDKYPYEAVDAQCRYTDDQADTSISGYTSVQQNSESALQDAAQSLGPVAVAIDASNLQSYSSGVFVDNQCSSTQLNHGVLVVGMGNQNGQDYYIVKNSWGETWGESGYVKMSRNANNQCGIASYGYVPTM